MPTAPETKTPEQRARELHEWFCKNTNQPLPLTMDRLMLWEQWLARGHNGPELAKVIRHLRDQIAGALQPFVVGVTLQFHQRPPWRSGRCTGGAGAA